MHSALVWNVHGLTSAGTASLYGTHQYLDTFDFVFLSETALTAPPPWLLPRHTVHTLPATVEGRAGQGLLLGVRTSLGLSVSLWPTNPASGTLWLRLRHPASPELFFFGVSYMPPSTSRQMQQLSADDRFDALQRQVQEAAGMGAVLLGGDFNGRIGTWEPPVPLQARLPQRGCTDQTVNQRGKQLVEFCDTNGLVLCTGRAAGDEAAPATLRATSRTAPSRPDHLLVSPAAAGGVTACKVNSTRGDSDHHPLELRLQLFARQPRTPPLASGRPLQQLMWRAHLQRNYARELDSPEPAACIRRCHAAADTGDIDAAEEHFCRALVLAGKAAGAKQRSLARTSRPGRHQHDAPFYDPECQTAKAVLRRLLRMRPQPTAAARRAAEHAYHSLVRQKKRLWQRQQLDELLESLHKEPRSFWVRINALHSSMPLHLRDPAAWDAYLRLQSARPIRSDCHLPAPPLSPGSQRPPAAALAADAVVELDPDVTASEIRTALCKLHNGRAAGGALFPAEFLRYAVTPHQQQQSADGPPPHMLAAHLARLFTAVMRLGRIPAGWSTSLITPLHKKGDPADTANYRPIAVGVPLVRLYASVLNLRLVAFLEQHGLRSPTQAGFRPHMSTNHHLFALQHLVDKRHRQKRQLYACFVDLTAAYDCVQRSLLWEALQRNGVRDRMLGAIQALYHNTSIAVKMSGRVGGSQPSCVGVRQGCPLSPTLFGIFIDGLHDYLEHNAPATGIRLTAGQTQRSVSHLVYADDIVLLAEDPGQLQRLIDALSGFCLSVGLDISAGKTQVLVFHAAAGATLPTFTFAGRPLPHTDSYKYLGITFTRSGRAGDGLSQLCSKTGLAYHKTRGKFARLGCGQNLYLQLHLFDACVTATAATSCEHWGVHPAAAAGRKTLETQHRRYIKQICGLPASVDTSAMLAELNRAPLPHRWLSQSLGFWNSICEQPEGSLHRDLLADNQWEAVHFGSTRAGRNFAWGLRRACQEAGYQMQLSATRIAPVDADCVLALCQHQQLQQQLHGLDLCPRTCTSATVRCTYRRWFARTTAQQQSLQLYRQRSSPTQLRRYLRFRLSCTRLPVVEGRRGAVVPRHLRLCQQCSMGAMGDQRHVVFECAALQHVRDRFRMLFCGGQTMRDFMNQKDQRLVMQFVVACLDVFDLD